MLPVDCRDVDPRWHRHSGCVDHVEQLCCDQRQLVLGRACRWWSYFRTAYVNSQIRSLVLLFNEWHWKDVLGFPATGAQCGNAGGTVRGRVGWFFKSLESPYCNQTEFAFYFRLGSTKVKGQHQSIFKRQLSSVFNFNILVAQCKILTMFHLKWPFNQFPNL